MFMARGFLNPVSRAVRVDLADVASLHRTIMRAFPDGTGPSARRAHGVLHRIDEDERRFPVFNEQRCRRCGTCMGACPVRVISFENYSVDTVGSQIKAVDMPDEFSERPRILILACENDAYPALDMAGLSRIVYSAFVRIIPVRCLGSVNTIWITDALNAGYDGVMKIGRASCRERVLFEV